MFKNKCILLIILIGFASCANKVQNSDISPLNADSIQIENSVEHFEPELTTGDTAIFEWESDLCHYIGKYLPAHHSRKKIQATLDLWQKAIYGMTTDWSATSLDNVNALNVNNLDEEYYALKEYYDATKPFVPTYFQKKIEVLKKNREREYKLKRITLLAYKDPSVLLSNEFEQGDCGAYAKAVNSSNVQDLYNAWEKWVHETKVNNGQPEMYVQRYIEKLNSPDKLMYARIDLITYGWWNCMNRTIDNMDDEDFAEEFKKFFISIDEECDEP